MIKEKHVVVSRTTKAATSRQTNKGPWMRYYPGVMKELFEFVLINFYDGDRKRLSDHRFLYTNENKFKLLTWMQTKHPEIIEFYKNRYQRELTGHHIADRLRFLFRQYKDGKLILGRSKEYRDVIQ